MSEGALDLSLSSYEAQRSSRCHDQVSSDSGRASSDSISSDIHEDVKPRFRTSPPRTIMPPGGVSVTLNNGDPLPPSDPHSTNNPNTHGPRSEPISGVSMPYPPSPRLRNLPPHLASSSGLAHQHPQPTTTSIAPSSSPVSSVNASGRISNPNSPEAASSLQDEDFKPSLPSTMSNSLSERGTDPRVAPIRPFKMYPVDAFNIYNPPTLMPGSSAAGGGLSPSPVGIQSLYDSGSPSSFPGFPLTPLTSHLLQRKRRAELRENPSTAPCSTGTKSEDICTVMGRANNSNINTNSNSGMSPGLSINGGEVDSEDGGSDDKKAKIVPDERKDDAYWDRRRKNNEAAKRSRDARRQKEEEIAMRAAFLEQENLKLRAQVAILKNETAKLHYMLYNRI